MDENDHTPDEFISIPYGLQLQHHHDHAEKYFNIQAVTYNSKHHKHILLDSRAIRGWVCSFGKNIIRPELSFDSYKFNVLRDILYCRSFDLYFVLTKEYQLKVYNINFHETFVVESDGMSITCLMYNSKREELITVGHNKLRFWQLTKLKNNSNVNQLFLAREYEVAETLLVCNAYFDENQEKIYLLSDFDVWCYKYNGNLSFRIKNASTTHLSVCVYSHELACLVTGSICGSLDFFSSSGSKIKTLSAHTNIVTAVILHPSDFDIFFSCSLDGNIKIFSFHLMQEIYTVNALPEGVQWMKVQSNFTIYAASHRSIKTFYIDIPFKYWGFVNSYAKKINVFPKWETKSSHVIVYAKDNSIKIYQSKNGQRKLSLLPPPELSIGQNPISVAYDRFGGVMFVLFDDTKLWIYLTKTDPATRVATWDIKDTISNVKIEAEKTAFGKSLFSLSSNQDEVKCECVATLQRNLFYTNENDTSLSILLSGLSNGLLLFIDPFKNGDVVSVTKCHFASPVIEIIVDYCSNVAQILTIVKTASEFLFQFWQVESMLLFKELETYMEYDLLAFKNSTLALCDNSGSLTVVELKNVDNKSSFRLAEQTFEHKGKISSIDLHFTEDILCTSGTDNFIRIWNFGKRLLFEIELDNTLCCAVFLNNTLTILASFKSNLFIIPEHRLLHLQAEKYWNDECDSDESFVYEDFYDTPDSFVKYDSLSNYLIPYPHLELDKNWQNKVTLDLLMKGKSDTELNENIDQSDSDIDSFADTDIYQDTIESCSIKSDDIKFPTYIMSPESLNGDHDIFDDVPDLNSNPSSFQDVTDISNTSMLENNVRNVPSNFYESHLNNSPSKGSSIIDQIKNLQQLRDSTLSFITNSSTHSSLNRRNSKISKKKKRASISKEKKLNIETHEKLANASDKNIATDVETTANSTRKIVDPNRKIGVTKDKKKSENLIVVSKTSKSMNKYKSKIESNENVSEKHENSKSSIKSVHTVMKDSKKKNENASKNNHISVAGNFKFNVTKGKQVTKSKVQINVQAAQKVDSNIIETSDQVSEKGKHPSQPKKSSSQTEILKPVSKQEDTSKHLNLLDLPVSESSYRPRSLTEMVLGQHDETVSKSFKNVFNELLGETTKREDHNTKETTRNTNYTKELLTAVSPNHQVDNSNVIEESTKFIDSKNIALLNTGHCLDKPNDAQNVSLQVNHSNYFSEEYSFNTPRKLTADRSTVGMSPHVSSISLKSSKQQLSNEMVEKDALHQSEESNRSCLLAMKSKFTNSSLCLSKQSKTNESNERFPEKKYESVNQEQEMEQEIKEASSGISVTISEKKSGVLLNLNESMTSDNESSVGDFSQKDDGSAANVNDTSQEIFMKEQIKKFIVGAFKATKNVNRVKKNHNDIASNCYKNCHPDEKLGHQQKHVRECICTCEKSIDVNEAKDENNNTMPKSDKENENNNSDNIKTENKKNNFVRPEILLHSSDFASKPANSLEKLSLQPVTKISFHRPSSHSTIIQESFDSRTSFLLEKNPVLRNKLLKHKERKEKRAKSADVLSIDRSYSSESKSLFEMRKSTRFVQPSKEKVLNIENMKSTITSPSVAFNVSEERSLQCFSPTNDKVIHNSSLEAIRILENKLSGTCHRFAKNNSIEDLSNSKVKLDFLKSKENGCSQLPVLKTSISIPSQQRTKTVELPDRNLKMQRRVVSPHVRKKRTTCVLK